MARCSTCTAWACSRNNCFPGQGSALGVLWRDKQIEYTRLVTTSNGGSHYQPFWELTRAALRYACKRLALQLTPASEERLMNQYRHLSAFPENKEVLAALKDKGVVTGILSNGDPEMLGIAVRSAGSRRPARPRAQRRHGAQIQDPSRRLRAGAAGHRPGCQADRLCQLQCLGRPGATWFGYRTLWVNRYQLPFEELGTQPTRTGANLRDVLAFF